MENDLGKRMKPANFDSSKGSQQCDTQKGGTPKSTEGRHPLGDQWAQAETLRALEIFASADLEAALTVHKAGPELASVIDLVAECLCNGGRLIYVGAGTSGRLAALDAAECVPTFQSDPSMVQALLAGGPGAMTIAVEGAEDDAVQGARDIEALALGQHDIAFGISASGGAQFVHGALSAARVAGAHTVLLACVSRTERPDDYEHSIRLPTGPELLSGSTRMKAGTATKMALGALSTLVMARLGKVHGHRMIDVNTQGNDKLWRRGVGLVGEVCNLPEDQAEALLHAADGAVKCACVMHHRGISLPQAREALAENGGHLQRTLDSKTEGQVDD